MLGVRLMGALALVAAVLGGAMLGLSCSAIGGSTFPDDGEGGSTSSSGTGAGMGLSTGTGGMDFDGGHVGGGCDLHCSADLHRVLDCNDVVQKTCPPEQGCGPGGTCVAPCESATANKSTIGCDFYSVIPGPEYETRGGCFAAALANTWTTPVTITAAWGSTSADGATIARVPVGQGTSIVYQPLSGGKLQPGELGLVFLAQYNSGDIFHVPCPSGTVSLVNGPTEINGTGYGTAFHITTDRPVVAYDIFPWGGASSFVTSATLLVPTPSWGDNIIAVDAYQANPSLAFVNGYPHLQIVAAADNTAVTIAPTSAIAGGGGSTRAPRASRSPTT
jgi:hypothetical protein